MSACVLCLFRGDGTVCVCRCVGCKGALEGVLHIWAPVFLHRGRWKDQGPRSSSWFERRGTNMWLSRVSFHSKPTPCRLGAECIGGCKMTLGHMLTRLPLLLLLALLGVLLGVLFPW